VRIGSIAAPGVNPIATDAVVVGIPSINGLAGRIDHWSPLYAVGDGVELVVGNRGQGFVANVADASAATLQIAGLTDGRSADGHRDSTLTLNEDGTVDHPSLDAGRRSANDEGSKIGRIDPEADSGMGSAE
jgi:hypothetical protein